MSVRNPICILTRLHLTPTPREKRTRTRTQQVTTSEPASKKPRYDTTTTSAVSTSASGCIHITKVDPSGGYVEIKNMSNEVSYISIFSFNPFLLSLIIVWWETFEGENLHEFCDFTAAYESFLVLGIPCPLCDHFNIFVKVFSTKCSLRTNPNSFPLYATHTVETGC